MRRPRLPKLPVPRQIASSLAQRIVSFGRRIRGQTVFWTVCAVYFTAKLYWTELEAIVRATPDAALHVVNSIKAMPWHPASVAGLAVVLPLAGPLLLSILGWLYLFADSGALRTAFR